MDISRLASPARHRAHEREVLNTMAFPSCRFSFRARPRATITYSACRDEKGPPKRSGRRLLCFKPPAVSFFPLNAPVTASGTSESTTFKLNPPEEFGCHDQIASLAL